MNTKNEEVRQMDDILLLAHYCDQGYSEEIAEELVKNESRE